MVLNLVLIIAEAGVNHNGSLTLAKELIDAAKDCNADVIKFQLFKADERQKVHKKLIIKDKANVTYRNLNVEKT